MLVPPLQQFDVVGHDRPVSDVAVPGTSMHFCNGELLLVYVPFHYTYFLFWMSLLTWCLLAKCMCALVHISPFDGNIWKYVPPALKCVFYHFLHYLCFWPCKAVLPLLAEWPMCAMNIQSHHKQYKDMKFTFMCQWVNTSYLRGNALYSRW
jgi:hypothetical protein